MFDIFFSYFYVISDRISKDLQYMINLSCTFDLSSPDRSYFVEMVEQYVLDEFDNKMVEIFCWIEVQYGLQNWNHLSWA